MADPLEALLRPATSFLNRRIGEVTPARELCARLDGKTIAIRLRDTALAMYFLIEDEVIVLAANSDAEPDVVITGSLLTLAGMLGSGGEQAIRDGKVDLTGDATIAEAFQDLLRFVKPEVEEELSTLIGDVAAHRLGKIARGVGNWSRDARATMRGNVREYLQEESRDVPSRYEVERFAKRVDVLRDDVERLEVRIRRLKSES